MGKALAISLCALVAGVVLLFLAHGIWGAAATWWLPPVISVHGHAYDAEFNRTLTVVAAAFMLAQCGLAYMVFRFRAAKRASARHIQGSARLEAAWTLITLTAFGALAILGEQLWFRYNQNLPPSAGGRDQAVHPVDVEVTAKQFAWNFRYPGADGLFGRIDPHQIDDAGGNPVGVDEKDPAGRDDIVTATLSLQVNRPVHLIFRSQDVIHSFFVPGLRFKQDLVPGMEINGYFTPTATGRYEIACAELCGLGHYKMKAYMDVLSEQDFSVWWNGQGLGHKDSTAGQKPVPKDPLEVVFLGRQNQRDAWRRFKEQGRYRWARPSDFPALQPSGDRDIAKAIQTPLQGGDINHDGAFNDFVVIVVDTTQPGPDRFGIVIFNEPLNRTGPYTAHWLVRNKDLSRTILQWNSGGLYITRVGPDEGVKKGFATGQVTWDSKAGKYVCH